MSALPTTPETYVHYPERRNHRVWAGGIIVFAGLALMAMAGGFLTANLALIAPELFEIERVTRYDKDAILGFQVVAYILAAICLVSGLLVIRTGLRGLVRIMNEG